MKDIRNTLDDIVEVLNRDYSQQEDSNEDFLGCSVPPMLVYDEHTVISFWSCGAIVCIKHILYFISEDDGNWWINEDKSNYSYGLQDNFSIAWTPSFISALSRLNNYVHDNGKPVYYSGTKNICYYTL